MEGLLWAHRSMIFFALVLRDLLRDYDESHRTVQEGWHAATENLTPYFREAYQRTLAPHATWMMGILFEVWNCY